MMHHLCHISSVRRALFNVVCFTDTQVLLIHQYSTRRVKNLSRLFMSTSHSILLECYLVYGERTRSRREDTAVRISMIMHGSYSAQPVWVGLGLWKINQPTPGLNLMGFCGSGYGVSFFGDADPNSALTVYFLFS
jgi:hypothetical protein